jgi:hypothetical protein
VSIRQAGAIILASTLLLAACTPAPMPSEPSSAPPTAAPPPSASPSVATGPRELAAGALPAGTYTRSGFVPPVTFAIDDGWVGATVTDEFFDVQQDQGTPDVIAVQFALVNAVIGAGGGMIPTATAAEAVATMKQNAGLVVFGESASRLGGLDGLTIEVENDGPIRTPVMSVAPGTLSFDPGRRLWISFFDTPDGLLAVLVGGSVAEWDRALAVAEPVLESIVIGASTP